MEPIRVVSGTGRGPTATASYDAALAAANVHDYNLVTVSSVVPVDATLEVVETAPDLGPAGNRLTVVQGRSTVAPGETGPAVAGLGWSRPSAGAGLFYEDGGTDPDAVSERVEAGLEHGRSLRPDRDWEGGTSGYRAAQRPAAEGSFTTAVALGMYGASEPLL
jgi:arginine decarboxylase